MVTPLVSKYTRFADQNNLSILLGDTLVSKISGIRFKVIYDYDLGIAVKDVVTGTLEKLTKEIAESMEIENPRLYVSRIIGES